MQELFSQFDFSAEPLWPLDVRQDRAGTPKLIATLAAVAITFGLLTAGRILWANQQHVFTFCPANGILVAFLLCRARNRWWMMLAAAWLASTLVIFMFHGPLGMSATLSLANILEVLIAASLVQRAILRNGDMAAPPVMFQFVLYALLLAPAVSGFLAGIWYHLTAGVSLWLIFRVWFPPHVVGMAVMVPLTLVLSSPELRKQFSLRHRARAVGVLLLILGASMLIFHEKQHSLTFLLLPLLMLIVFEIGILGAVIATFQILVVGAFFTLHGQGPFWIAAGETLRGSVFLLQLAIVVLAVSIVPFAATLDRQRQLRRRLQQGMRQYRLLADNSRDIVVLANLEGRRLYVSPAVHDVLGWTQQEWVDQDVADFMHREDIDAFQKMLKEMIAGAERRTIRYRTRHKKGNYVWMEANLRTLPDEITGEPNAFVANVRDISEHVESERRLAEAHEHVQQQAQRDSLTQLANRRCFDETLEKEWRRGRRTGNPLALLMVDIDHFKDVNDTYGHRAGDMCLQSLAAVLRTAARRPSDLVARYGGEEFTVLLPDIDLAAAAVIADMLRLRVRQRLFDTGNSGSLGLTVSIGVAAQVPEKNARADTLVEAADRALYMAKESGRDRVMPEYEREISSAMLYPVK